MSITYRFTIDESYCRQRFERESKYRKWFFRLSTQNTLMLVLGAAAYFIMLSLEGGSKYVPVILAAVALGLLGNVLREKLRKVPTFVQKALLRQKRKDPDFEVATTVTFSDTSVVESGSVSEKSAAWKSFTGAIRFSDGIMLSRFGYLLWLPDSSLTGSTSQEATEFVATRTNLCHRE